MPNYAHTMNTYEGAKVILALDGGKWSTYNPVAVPQRETVLGTPWHRRVGGTQGKPRCCGKENTSWPCWELKPSSSVIQPQPSHYVT
jgi:hypothetical protein